MLSPSLKSSIQGERWRGHWQIILLYMGLGEAEHLFCLSTKNKQMLRLSEAQKSVLMLGATNVGPLRGPMYSSMLADNTSLIRR